VTAITVYALAESGMEWMAVFRDPTEARQAKTFMEDIWRLDMDLTEVTVNCADETINALMQGMVIADGQ
jgi:hypothetical protein